jgi:hypothetical protein
MKNKKLRNIMYERYDELRDKDNLPRGRLMKVVNGEITYDIFVPKWIDDLIESVTTFGKYNTYYSDVVCFPKEGRVKRCIECPSANHCSIYKAFIIESEMH